MTRRKAKWLGRLPGAAFALLPLLLSAQDSSAVRELSPNGLRAIVRAYHPIVRIADLRVGQADAVVLGARGAFDPSIGAALDRKSYDGKLYYSYGAAELQIPSWYGLEFKAGTEEIVGDRLNPERTFGTTSYAGVKWNATSIVLDTRRAVLRQARALQDGSRADQRNAANDVQFDALVAYWNWVQSYATLRVLESAVQVSAERLRFVQVEYDGGARPAIDTTEALAQLQSFGSELEDARLDWLNSGLQLSAFLWTEDGQPVRWSDRVVPDSASLALVTPALELPSLGEMLAALPNHPKLQSIGFKIGVLRTDQLLKQQYLLPKVSLYAGALSPGYFRTSEVTAPLLQNNHKVALDLSIPLFLREARGAFRGARLKVDEALVTRDQTALELEVKVRSYYNGVLQLEAQIAAMEGAFDSYRRLFAGERIRYEAGESTLFLINARESKLLETRRKLIDLRAKWQKSRVGVLWAAGLLE